VAFDLDKQRFALHLSVVERVVPVVEITPLPNAPEVVRGVINIQGRVLPVFDVRRRLGLPSRPVRLSDHMILARTARRSVALWVDGVRGIVEPGGEPGGKAGSPENITPAEGVLPGLEMIEGVVNLEDGLVLIHDLARFLSLEEERALDGAMAANRG
jgi:purine-binding chemotaxis protein CheW